MKNSDIINIFTDHKKTIDKIIREYKYRLKSKSINIFKKPSKKKFPRTRNNRFNVDIHNKYKIIENFESNNNTLIINQEITENYIFNNLKFNISEQIKIGTVYFDFKTWENDNYLPINFIQINIPIEKKQINLKPLELLGKGTFGKVYLFGDNKKNVYFNIKIEIIFKKYEVYDGKISNISCEFGETCHLLRIKQIHQHWNETNNCGYNVYLMDKFDGDLTRFTSQPNKRPNGIITGGFSKKSNILFFAENEEDKARRIIMIAEIVRKSIYCLYLKSNKKFIYCDVKLANILFNFPYKNEKDYNVLSFMKIYIGDLGGAVPNELPNGIKSFATTYPPPDIKPPLNNGGLILLDSNKPYIWNKNARSTLSWQIGIIIISLILFVPINNVNYSEIIADEDGIDFNLLHGKYLWETIDGLTMKINNESVETIKYFQKFIFLYFNKYGYSNIAQQLSDYLSIYPESRSKISKQIIVTKK